MSSNRMVSTPPEDIGADVDALVTAVRRLNEEAASREGVDPAVMRQVTAAENVVRARFDFRSAFERLGDAYEFLEEAMQTSDIAGRLMFWPWDLEVIDKGAMLAEGMMLKALSAKAGPWVKFGTPDEGEAFAYLPYFPIFAPSANPAVER